MGNIDDTTNNPKTGDNIWFNIIVLGLSIIGIIGVGIYARRGKED